MTKELLFPDQEWLDAMNAERRKEQLDQVTYETFEIIMDRLEKEWFELVSLCPLPLLFLRHQPSNVHVTGADEACSHSRRCSPFRGLHLCYLRRWRGRE